MSGPSYPGNVLTGVKIQAEFIDATRSSDATRTPSDPTSAVIGGSVVAAIRLGDERWVEREELISDDLNPRCEPV